MTATHAREYDATLLAYPDDITCLYTLYPILRSEARRRIRFVTDPFAALHSPAGSILMTVRLGKAVEPLGMTRESFLLQARERYEQILFIDNTAAAGWFHADVLPLVDTYYKRSVYRDRALYSRPVEAGRLFVDWYRRQGLLSEREPAYRSLGSPQVNGAQIKPLWNLAFGSYPRTQLRKRAAAFLASNVSLAAVRRAYRRTLPKAPSTRRRESLVSARFGTSFSVEGIRYHRELFARIAFSDSRFLAGRVSQRRYNRELRTVAATLSPFGYGEECLRDYEAVLSGSVLIKPDMSHVETSPNIYVPWETYVPCSWDGADLVDVSRHVLSDAALRTRICDNARAVVADAHRTMSARVAELFSGADFTAAS
ncbi:MAG: hypothetical protein ACOCZ9_03140 [Spirochaetota bacterium]